MKRLRSGVVGLLSVLVPLHAQQGVRALPDDNLGYPVLISIGNSQGSGFYINTDDATYLVTATHVLYTLPTTPNVPRQLYSPMFELLSYSRDPADLVPNRIAVDTNLLGAANIIRHPAVDVTVVRLFRRPTPNTAQTLPGVTLVQMSVAGLLGTSRDTIARLNEVLVGNDVYLFGYPSSLALGPVPQIDPRRPLLRKGIVAGINNATHSIILDCPAYPGNSGGPVIEADQVDLVRRHFRIIGVVDQYVPYADGGRTFSINANSGYSVIIPMDFVLELVNVR
jgi:hypothetical protein